MKAIKGFDANLQCRGFQFEVGKTYRHEGDVVPCKGGFHAIPDDQHPLAVFSYYPPAVSRFCIVEVEGKTARREDKIAAEILSVTREISLGDLAQEAVDFVMARAKCEGPVATDRNGLATASGDQGAATASGEQGAATASGYQGAATASGEHSNAHADGFLGMVRGADGCGLYAVEREAWDGPIVSNACGIVGRDGIKPGTWYRCVGGKLVEVTP